MSAAFIVRDGDATARTITEMVMLDGDEVARTITEGWIRDPNNVLRAFYDPSGSLEFSVSLDKGLVSGISLGTGTATTATVTATPSGGTSPYTYAWTRLTSTSGTNPTANSASSAATTFTQTGMSPGDSESSTWRVTVTDDEGLTVTADVQANFFDAGGIL